MTSPDAQSYWISRRIPTDQFLLYCFVGTTEPLTSARDQLLARAATIGDLCLRVREVPRRLDVPHWAPAAPDDSSIRLHEDTGTWRDCLTVLGELVLDQVEPAESPWRIHLFGPLVDAPDSGGAECVVAVLQVSHALADGRRAAAIARDLFADAAPTPSPPLPPWRPRRAAAAAAIRLPIQVGRMLLRARPAHHAHRQRERDTAAGLVPPKPLGRPKLPTNAAPDERRTLGAVVVPAADLRGPGVSVTVGALTAISLALGRYLLERGVDPSVLAAEVTVAKPGIPDARNHFRNFAVELHSEVDDPAERAAAIAESLRQRRLRADHPSGAAEDRALDAVPAPLLRHGIEHFDFTAVPDEVTGHTVVSSVDRGPADLVLAGGRVGFTAGFPALSRFMGLTHGVHGIGDRVTIAVATSPAVMPDVDAYERLLSDAVTEVARALHAGRDRTGS
ncbi:WS/DGAT domain-containing protein [Rhodococcus sp. Q]|uniref:WS/DGAT domain-containing protein n=1 Tax=Rhodococcus sp. Q TaxID=2502252 RepID=UPI0010F567B9|nr:WS/DGAT domain-containing protein [Rhodococcus sp. Q]